jgi:hypothetical protein
MDFLKKNYEKVLLGLVLLGLTIAVASLPVFISHTREKIEAAAQKLQNPSVKELPPLDTKPEDSALQRVQTAFKLDFTTKHNLFNPVLWQKMADGHLIKIISGNELGAGALVVTAINPLYLKLSYKSPTANGYFVTIEDQAAPANKRSAHDIIVGKDTKGDYNLVDVKGPAEKPTELVLEVKETSESISLGPEHPFKRIDGYSADLKYPPEAGWARNNQRVDASLSFGGGAYKIVAITQSNVVVSAKSNDKKTTITFNPPTEPR